MFFLRGILKGGQLLSGKLLDQEYKLTEIISLLLKIL